jgi:hypothetical protein
LKHSPFEIATKWVRAIISNPLVAWRKAGIVSSGKIALEYFRKLRGAVDCRCVYGERCCGKGTKGGDEFHGEVRARG